MSKLVKVALPIPTNQLFTYKLPESDTNAVGKRAIVPLMNREVTGIIVEFDDSDYKSEIKDVLDIPDKLPIFSENMLKFTRWMSEYYMTSWGETLKIALPPGFFVQSTTKFKLSDLAAANPTLLQSIRGPRQAEIVNLLSEHNSYVTVAYIEKKLGTKISASQLNALESAGIIEIEDSKIRAKSAKKVKMLAISEKYLNDEIEVKIFLINSESKKPSYGRIFSLLYLQHMNGIKGIPSKNALDESKVSRSVVNTLIKKGVVYEYEIESAYVPVTALTPLATKDEINAVLSDEQNECVTQICDAIDKNNHEPILLHGVTGSGKTLVYMQAVRKVLDMGKTALLLVPEIALTPQLIDRFRKVFSNQLAVLHSGMKDSERFESWNALKKGEYRIALGARSALFAPIDNLGIIIVDEEHDSSYKQDSPSPRYQARDSAVMRAKIEDCLCVLGSATPSIESMYNTTSKYKIAQIKNRADGAEMPEVTLLDTISATKNNQMIGSFSRLLLDKIVQKVNRKEGVIILQNRRGFASVVCCNECGFIPECSHCSVKLTYHKPKEALICHYCGYSEKMITHCKACDTDSLALIGTGTQRIEAELASLLSERGVKHVIKRMDSDSVKQPGSLRRILTSFAKGDTDILVGTQMLAKGIDIDRVTLIGVINADLQLLFPDFRSAERTFQLLTQISGRAGRQRDFRGEVILQSFNPTHYAVKLASTADYDAFYAHEIELRREVFYPPYVRFIAVEFYGGDETKVISYAKRFASLFPKSAAIHEIMGPVIPTIARISNNYRRVIYIKGNKSKDPSGAITRAVIRDVLKRFELPFSKNVVMIKIDIDSYSSL
ncbi:MAG: primosomal protein N' [Ignavibacteriae bacterium HGW-Ignavibacteriae-1]|jgi:primosomal protein N' (replication factor Y)|nr:MAG: primosomal protein N' [Ignavibacteriae bacterium HGW-Ignavibacteriae-1]